DVEPWPARLRFSVNEATGPWTVRVSEDREFAEATYHVINSSTEIDGIRYAQMLVPLDAGKTYYWQAREGDNPPTASWGTCGAFTAWFATSEKRVNIRVPNALHSDGYYQTDHRGYVAWEHLSGASSYEALLRDSSDGCDAPDADWEDVNESIFAAPAVFLGDTLDQPIFYEATKLRPDAALDPTVTYHLYVRARGSNGELGTCNHFPVRKLQLLPFQQIAPLEYETVPYSSGGPFIWTPSAGADHYELLVWRLPPGDGISRVAREVVTLDRLTMNAEGNLEFSFDDGTITTVGGEMRWEVWA